MNPTTGEPADGSQSAATTPGDSLRHAAGPYFGEFGGRCMPESLVAAHRRAHRRSTSCQGRPGVRWPQLMDLHRPTPGAPRSSPRCRGSPQHAGGARIFLKREDLNHTGSHKINNVLGQALLTKRIGKTRVIAETGAGQHGVATATAAALFGLDCVVYMGEVDTERQALNVARMRLLGAEVDPGHRRLPHPEGRDQRGACATGSPTSRPPTTSSAPWPAAPVPRHGARLPEDHRRRGARAGARARPAGCPTPSPPASAAVRTRSASSTPSSTTPTSRSTASRPPATASTPRATRQPSPRARPACCTAPSSYVLQDEDGQTIESHSISAGLDYPGVGPEHAWLAEHRARQVPPGHRRRGDGRAPLLSRTEGIIPAIESAHALAGALSSARELGPDATIIIVQPLAAAATRTWRPPAATSTCSTQRPEAHRTDARTAKRATFPRAPRPSSRPAREGRPAADRLPARRLPGPAGEHRRRRRPGRERRRHHRARPAVLRPRHGRHGHPGRHPARPGRRLPARATASTAVAAITARCRRRCWS